MKREKFNFKFATIFALLVIFVIGYSSTTIYGMTNQQYKLPTFSYNTDDGGNLLTVIADILMPVIFPIFTLIQDIVSMIMKIFTGSFFFPWADKIIYNTIPFLDVNFINPSAGSLFLKGDGVTFTAIGNTVRSIYFTVLTLSLVFLSLCVAINAIKMLVSSLPSAKARYKELINSTVITVVLIFGMHYLISFVFYINEQLVQVASNLTTQIISPDTVVAANDAIDAAEEANNEQIVENFFEYCDETAWFSPVTIAKKVAKELVNLLDDLIDWVSGLFSDDDDDDAKVKLSAQDVRDSYDDVFPSKKDFISYFKDESKVGEHGIDVAAYLIKDYYYRDLYLWSVAGNDTNKFSNGGIGGTLTSLSNTLLWGTGIIDTGLNGLQNLYGSTYYVCTTMKAQNAITSAKDYQNKTNILVETLYSDTATDKEKNTARIIKLYYDAYYRYIYEGDDKSDASIKNIVSGLGEYFLRQSYYTDVDKGDWSPTTFSVIPSILYCIFVVQSFFFLYSYIKRMFYVIILALIGPIVVVYDYVMKSY